MPGIARPLPPDEPQSDTTAQLSSHLSALQLSDSGFPSGRYTLSYGLEALAQSGFLAMRETASTLLHLLHEAIQRGVAPSDGVALACAHRATGSEGRVDMHLVRHADERLSAVKLARESRDASTRTGRALLRTAMAALDSTTLRDYAERVDTGQCPGNQAVVYGVLSASLGVPRLQALAGELYAFAGGWVAAAVRLALIDHLTAQAILHRIRPVSAEAALNAADLDVDQISSCTPLLDIMAMRHEEAELRLFAS
jgi:urease accessory protein